MGLAINSPFLSPRPRSKGPFETVASGGYGSGDRPGDKGDPCASKTSPIRTAWRSPGNSPLEVETKISDAPPNSRTGMVCAGESWRSAIVQGGTRPFGGSRQSWSPSLGATGVGRHPRFDISDIIDRSSAAGGDCKCRSEPGSDAMADQGLICPIVLADHGRPPFALFRPLLSVTRRLLNGRRVKNSRIRAESGRVTMTARKRRSIGV